MYTLSQDVAQESCR